MYMEDTRKGWVRLLVEDLVDRIRITDKREILVDELTEGILEGIDEAKKTVRDDEERKMRVKLKAIGMPDDEIDALFDKG